MPPDLTMPLVEANVQNGPAIQGLLDRRPRVLLSILVAMFVLAAGVRLYRLDAHGVLVDRDFTSAILARDLYFRQADGIPAWRKDMARITREKQPQLEPPITEWLASRVYKVAGGEQLRLARLLTSCFWMVGGIALFSIARALVSTEAAVFATGFYLFSPLSILLSRSFQADALMMMLFLMSLLAAIRYFNRPSMALLWSAAILSAVTLIYRPLVLFALLGAFAVPVVQKNGWKAVFDKHLAIFAAVSVLPAVFYYVVYATLVARYFGWKFATSFRFDLLLFGEFWRGWWHLVVLAIGFPMMTAALAGVAMLRTGLPRAIVTGLALGYFAFGLLFTMHVHTHGYYHAQLIPLVAIAASPVVVLVLDHLRRTVDRWYWWVPAIGVLVLGLFASGREVRSALGQPRYEPEEVAREIGERVGHSSTVAFLAPYYGMPLQYYGEFTGAYWPRRHTYYLYPRAHERELSIDQRLDALGFEPEFFVVTAFDEFARNHADLRQYLANQCAPVAATPQYLIFGDCRRVAGALAD